MVAGLGRSLAEYFAPAAFLNTTRADAVPPVYGRKTADNRQQRRVCPLVAAVLLTSFSATQAEELTLGNWNIQTSVYAGDPKAAFPTTTDARQPILTTCANGET